MVGLSSNGVTPAPAPSDSGEAGVDTVWFPDHGSADVASITGPSGASPFTTILFTSGQAVTVSGTEYLAFTDTSLFHQT